MSKKNYKVVCDDLNLVLFVKGFALEEERDLYMEIRKRVSKADTPINIEEYKEFVVRKLLVDADTIFFKADEEGKDKEEIVDSLYEALINVYPPFSIEFICQDINTALFLNRNVDKSVINAFRAHMKKTGKIEEEVFPQSVQLSSIEELRELEEHLKSNIVGQNTAIKGLIKALKLMAAGLCGHSSFFFVGPTGVGKTCLSKYLGEKYSGNFYKVNCAEYAAPHEYAKLIGAPPGYIGHTDKSLLAEKADQSNKWVILFDEVEKAHPKLHDFLLSLLDDGTVTDNLGNTLDFKESIFIFTSNQGISEIKYDRLGFGALEEMSKEVTAEVIKTSIKNRFSPEFLNRIDDIIYFNPLTKKDVKKIAALELGKIPIKQTEKLIEYVVDNGYSQEYGARNIARFIKNNVSIKVADAILDKKVPKKEGEFYTPRMVDGQVRIIDTKKYEVSS